MSLINKQFDVNETRVFILAGGKQNDNDNDDDSDDDGVVTVVKPHETTSVYFFPLFCVWKNKTMWMNSVNGREFLPKIELSEFVRNGEREKRKQ